MAKNKVLFLITKATWGGAQRYVYDLTTNLPEQFEASVAFGDRGRLCALLEQNHVEIFCLSALGRDIAVISDIRSFFQIFSLLRKLRPNVIHLNSSKAAGLGALAARIAGVGKIITTIHGWPFKENRGALMRIFIYKMSWLTCMLSTKVIVVSKVDEEIGKRMWFVDKKIVYIPIGIKEIAFLSRDEAVRALSIAASGPRILTIAEFTHNKGIRYAIEAIAELKKRNVPAHYYVIGDGELRNELEMLVRKLNVSDRVVFLGFVENASNYLKAFDLFLLPSIKEGMPYVLLEAAQARLPIVCTNVISPDSLDGYENVRIVPAADSGALAGALIESMQSPFESELFPSRAALSEMVQQTSALYFAI
jgi:glycosyltransferase involved in cell wall biosynthesis